MIKEQKAVVLFSGGLDSTTILTGAIETFGRENVIALSLVYGQKHVTEMESAKKVAEHLEVRHIMKDVSSVFEFASNPLLGDGELPRGEYIDQLKEAGGVVPTYVPFRNGLLISIATAIAYSLEAQYVYYGAHADDAAGNAYPDCTRDFYEAMEAAIDSGTAGRIRLEAPLQKMTKADIVAAGLELLAPYHLTWSCYEGGEVACGTCATCLDRLKAFELDGVKDPVPYVEVK